MVMTNMKLLKLLRQGADLRAVVEGEFADELLGHRRCAVAPGVQIVPLQLDVRQVPSRALARGAHPLQQARQRGKLLPHQAVTCAVIA